MLFRSFVVPSVWNPVFRLRCVVPADYGTPVSYTHLDVYKRQILHRASVFSLHANPQNYDKLLDLYKRQIQHRTGRDLGATFLSGTVVVNARTELYVMFKYFRPRERKRQQSSCFDAWAAIFTKKTADYELNVRCV